MNYMISGKNIEVTEALKQKIEDKFERLSKFLNDDTHVHVTFSVQKLQQRVEITIPIKGTILRTEVEDHDMYVAIDKAIDILDKQVVKYRSKLKDKHRHDNTFKEEFLKELHDTELDEEVHNELKISKIKTFDVKPMAREEAIMQMNLLGHDFFVFRDMDSTGERINIIYKRKGGTYGLIDPEY
ncbi:MAG TPA: ribosome-associated translation inhibitor RaiA [Clostridiales bacterium]|nr:MAG: ribosomal subunit interface protein [Clostridiales bacterium GWD2_32_19]HCC06785.1 ribosome-associated translation inhibitor RaiA [Clostridiales bacterium]